MLGEAHMLYISGEYDKATPLLEEFIRQTPTVPDPYHTLGTIYEYRKEYEKALQFFLIGAHLTKKDADLWKRVAALAQEQCKTEQAIYCLSRAIKLRPSDTNTILDRAMLYSRTEDFRRAADSFRQLTKTHPQDIALWLHLAEACHRDGQIEEGIKALQTCIKASYESSSATANDVGLNAVNMLADLFISLERYAEAVEVIQGLHCRLQSRAGGSSTDTPVDVSLPLDIAVKYGICCVHLDDTEMADKMFTHLYAQEPTKFGDLYEDVADAYETAGKYGIAIKVYDQLMKCPKFDTEAIWKRVGRQCEKAKRYKGALVYYTKALEKEKLSDTIDDELVYSALNCFIVLKDAESGLRLFDEYAGGTWTDPITGRIAVFVRSKRKTKCATMDSADEEDESSDDDKEPEGSPNGVRFRIMICWVLLQYELKNYVGVCDVGVPPLLACLSQADVTARKRTLTKDYVVKRQATAVDLLRRQTLCHPDGRQKTSGMSVVSGQIASRVGVASELGPVRFSQLCDAVICSLGERGLVECGVELGSVLLDAGKLKDKSGMAKLQLRVIAGAIDEGLQTVAYCNMRNLLSDDPTNAQLWYLFNYITSGNSPLQRQQKYIARSLIQHPESISLMALCGNHSLVCQFPHLAFGEYTIIHERRPKDPLPILCTAVATLSTTMNRILTNRQLIVGNAIGFFQMYKKLRLESSNALAKCVEGDARLGNTIAKMETSYNLGRAYQQLGLLHVAIPCYEQVLRENDSNDKAIPEIFSLVMDTAHNLSLIYSRTGSPELARNLLKRYNTID